MKSLSLLFGIVFFTLIIGCSTSEDEVISDLSTEGSDVSKTTDDVLSMDGDGIATDEGSFSTSEASGGSSSPSGGGDGNNDGSQNQAGVITAGEWNDLDNWDFWLELITNEQYDSMSNYWSFYNNNRVSVVVKDGNSDPVVDAKLELKRGGVTIFESRTDNSGSAELWTDLFQSNSADFSSLSISVNNDAITLNNVVSIVEGVNNIVTPEITVANKVDIAFVVDATGSMGDELEYLKTELVNVISRAKSDNSTASFVTASVFYRDEGDDYVTRVSKFSDDVNVTSDFINAQRAGGGGDFPEAVHSAMDIAVNELEWSGSAKSRLLFLLLDAPPHYRDDVIDDLQSSVINAAEKGIKIIPIVASGIDKQTEFLMRYMSMTTNGTYVFITDHSGVGGSHLEPSIGQYDVEKLNDLMVRLINEYSE